MSATKQCSCQGYNILDFICVSGFLWGTQYTAVIRAENNMEPGQTHERLKNRGSSFQLSKSTSAHTNFIRTTQKDPSPLIHELLPLEALLKVII